MILTGHNKIAGTSLLSMSMLFLVLIVSSSIAAFSFSIFILLVGYGLCLTIDKQDRNSGFTLFNIVFSLLTLFAVLHYLDAVTNYDEFAQGWRDEYKFWLISEELGHLSSISDIFKTSYTEFIYSDLPGYSTYIGSISYIAKNYFDGNNLLLQFNGSLVWSSLMSIIIYKTSLLYVNNNQAYINALCFSLFTVIFAYSFVFLRDIMISFLYSVMFYIILKNYSLKNLFFLIICTLLIWQIRFEHGLFSIAFILLYLISKFKKRKLAIIIAGVIVTSITLIVFRDLLVKSFSTIERYGSRGELSAMDKSDSLGKTLYGLPLGIKEIAFFVTSQIRPFPSWSSLMSRSSGNIFSVIVNSLPLIYSLYWFVVSFSAFKWTLLNKKYKALPAKLKGLFGISIFFLFIVVQGASDLRRIMAVYPIIFFVYLYIKSREEHPANIKRTRLQAILFYLLIVGVYLLTKYS